MRKPVRQDKNWNFNFNNNNKQYKVIVKITAVTVDKYYPQGVKYSYVLLENNTRIIEYDNYEKKGNHKHIKDKIEKMDPLQDIYEILNQFNQEVEEYEENGC